MAILQFKRQNFSGGVFIGVTRQQCPFGAASPSRKSTSFSFIIYEFLDVINLSFVITFKRTLNTRKIARNESQGEP